MSVLRHSCAPGIGHADPCTRALPPQRAGDCPGPEASVRPKRSARAKPVSYVAEQQAGQHVEALKAAARLFLSDAHTKTVPDACRKTGVGENESDFRRVRRIVEGLRQSGAAKVLAAPELRERVLQSVATVPSAAAAVAAAAAKLKTRSDICGDGDRQAYSKAYKMIANSCPKRRRLAKELNFVIVLRPPHTTSRLQGEDTKHGFGTFQATFRAEKEDALVQRALVGETLSVADYMRVMRVAYDRAFNRLNCRKSWAKIGVIPFTRSVFWELVAEERHRAELKARSENVNKKEIQVQLQEMTAKSLVEARKTAGGCDGMIICRPLISFSGLGVL